MSDHHPSCALSLGYNACTCIFFKNRIASRLDMCPDCRADLISDRHHIECIAPLDQIEEATA